MIQHVSFSACPLKPLIVSAAVCAHMTPELVLASSVMLVFLIIVRKNVLIARPLLRRCQVIHAAPFNCNGAATFPSQHHAQEFVDFFCCSLWLSSPDCNHTDTREGIIIFTLLPCPRYMFPNGPSPSRPAPSTIQQTFRTFLLAVVQTYSILDQK